MWSSRQRVKTMPDYDALDYGMVKHHKPDALQPIRTTLEQGYSPDEIETMLAEQFPEMRHSWRKHIAGAARFIAAGREQERIAKPWPGTDPAGEGDNG